MSIHGILRASIRSLLVIGLLSLAACGTPSIESAVKFRVVEKGSENPIPGAHVIFFAQASHGSLGGGGPRWNKFLTEGVTDGTGEVSFLPRFFVEPSALIASPREGHRLYVYKPGYQLARRSSEIDRGSGEVFLPVRAKSVSGQDLPSVEMVPVTSEQDSILTLEKAIFKAEDAYIGVETCEWAKIPNFLLALSSERARLKAKAKSGVTDPKMASELSAIHEPVEEITRDSRTAKCSDQAKSLFPIPAPVPIRYIPKAASESVQLRKPSQSTHDD